MRARSLAVAIAAIVLLLASAGWLVGTTGRPLLEIALWTLAVGVILCAAVAIDESGPDGTA